jgi:hypothetical protein
MPSPSTLPGGTDITLVETQEPPRAGQAVDLDARA